jgi:hypothetical protein
VTRAGALAVMAPPLSVARAVSVRRPDGTWRQRWEYGAVASSPSFRAPSKNSTFVTPPPGSLAAAVIVIAGLKAKTAPSAGAVIRTAGGVFAARTVTIAAAVVVVAPRSSVARAVRLWVPAATPPHEKPYGSVVSSPSLVAPS